jgi:hypothetical protein
VLPLGLGAVTLWRTRDTDAGPVRRYGRRTLLAIAGLFAGALVAIFGYAYVTTHVGRAVVPPDRLGVVHENVTFTTTDGLELESWYIPSRNGAAVIAFPGRNGPHGKARMLARHGYGVLLFDRRGEGRSDGEPNSWGWGGATDVKAALAYLQTRPDVDPYRIGGIGLSVGGEMIEAAADTNDLAAVLSEGAGPDRPRRTWTTTTRPGTLGLAMSAVKTAAVAVSSNQAPPANLKGLAANVEQPMLLIAAPNAPTGEALNRGYATAAGDSATLWGDSGVRPRRWHDCPASGIRAARRRVSSTGRWRHKAASGPNEVAQASVQRARARPSATVRAVTDKRATRTSSLVDRDVDAADNHFHASPGCPSDNRVPFLPFASLRPRNTRGTRPRLRGHGCHGKEAVDGSGAFGADLDLADRERAGAPDGPTPRLWGGPPTTLRAYRAAPGGNAQGAR